MPRSVEEILEQAEELALRFENYEPRDDDERDVEAVALLREAVEERTEAERHLVEAVLVAREAGLSWAAIGSFIGTTGEAARQRYGGLVA